MFATASRLRTILSAIVNNVYPTLNLITRCPKLLLKTAIALVVFVQRKHTYDYVHNEQQQSPLNKSIAKELERWPWFKSITYCISVVHWVDLLIKATRPYWLTHL